MNYFGKYDVLGINVTACNYSYVVDLIEKSIKFKKKLVIAPIASHPIILAYFNEKLRKIINKIDLVAPDSQYVRLALWFLYGVELKDRVYGPELTSRLCKTAEKKEYKIFLYGNNIPKIKLQLDKLYPKIKICGFIDLNYKKPRKNNLQILKREIYKKKPDLLLFGLGSPRQQIVASELRNQINMPIICVGAAFDFISGAKKQAPKWMQKNGLEWLFRLINEPIRLWKRYLIDGTTFIALILIKKLLAVYQNNEKN